MSAVTAIATSSAHAADAGTDIHDTRSRYINEPWHKGVLFLDGRLAVRRGLPMRPTPRRVGEATDPVHAQTPT